MYDVEERLNRAGYHLPELPKANGDYVTAIVVNELLHTSGQLSRSKNGVLYGPIDDGENISQAVKAAEVCALRCLAVAKGHLGALNRISQVVSVRGFVAATRDFKDHSKVLDGASSVFRTVWPGSSGQHIRTAVGVSSLPSGGVVEIEAVFQIMA